MEDWLSDLLLKWKSEGVKLSPPASIAEIEDAESILKFEFPDDFKAFYLQANGFEGLDWQEHMFTFYPLKTLLEEYQESANKNFIVFSDFLLSSSFIGFNRQRVGIFKSYGQGDMELIANTFEIAVKMINSSNDLIY